LRIYDFDNARVALWGAGREAAAAYRALSALYPTAMVTVVSDAPATAAERANFAGGAPVRFLAAADGVAALRESELVIRSPGISRYRPEVGELLRAGVAMTTGTNLWLAEHRDDPVLIVTGTKGKSTTSALIAHMARQGGAEVLLAGNIGSPLLDHLAPEVAPDLWVIELSSYQAADLEHSPRAAVVLNLHPEHVDWHGTHERYFADKLNVLRDPQRVLAILNARDAKLRALQAPAHTTWFGAPDGYDAAGESVTCAGMTVLKGADSPLAGEHNALNICAALSALEVMGLPVSDPAAALRGFQSLPHRLQTVRTEGSLRFVDDSISTTPEATIAALAAFADSRVALLAGGFDRDQDYAELARAILLTRVHTVVALPDTGARLLEAIRQVRDAGDSDQSGQTGAEADERHAARPPHLIEADERHMARLPHLIEAADIDVAVHAARESLGEDGVVLLSPAAPSYGAFRNFEERGERFAQAAADLRTSGGDVSD
jgi:UDP-N-acetylmuramoylalanine--D-glutamate ligase